MATLPRYQEGGWGWAVVLANFTIELVFFGNLKALGVLIASMTEDFDTELWVVGSIASLHYAIQTLLAPLAAAIARKFGNRIVVFFGGMLYGVGLVMSAMVRHVAILAVALVVISGSGAVCTTWPAHSELAFYFREKYALAAFVTLTGSPVGMMLYGPVTQFLVDVYGWRGAMLLLGGVSFHVVVASMLVRRPPASYYAVEGNVETSDCASEEPGKSLRSKVWNAVVSVLYLDVFYSIEFIILSIIRMIYSIAYGGAVVYIVSNGLALGLSAREASFLTTAWGIGNLAGLVVSALALHMKTLSVRGTVGIAAIVSAVGLVLEPLVSNVIGQNIIAFIVGAGMGIAVEALFVMTRCLPFDDNEFVNVLGWQCLLSGLAVSVGDVIAGWLYDVTGSFHATFFLYSVAMATILLCLLLDIFCASTESSNQNGLMVLMTSLFRSDSITRFKASPIQPSIDSFPLHRS
ncbi:monocarboxylate transporter 13-like isoform X2 [Acanthaster planci]|nr:monocarboxylate transporter 13-like isoform X2 [Acanthaster planci]XP_022112177.1 monocarboxylate transporter 13-like isoform X2 [Acanthaster planci]XP_022112178.1 monocarboxylate transporter 13-like isoform X2 [Acanthaster planci]